MVRVLFFGALRDAAGRGELVCDPPPEVETLDGLRAWLATGNPELARAVRAPGVRAVRDRAFAPFDAPIAGADEIAFVPPLSGG